MFTPLRIFFNIAVILGDGETAAAYGPNWPLLVSLLVAIDLLTAAGVIWMAWRLYSHHVPQTLRVAKIGLWVLAFVPLLLSNAVVSLVSSISIVDLIISGGLESIRPFIYSAIWTLYLFNSQRVANTYGHSDATAESVVFE